MLRSGLALLFAVVLASLAFAQSTSPGRSNQPPPDKMKVGIAHFDKAFYDLTPHKRDGEAAAEFDQAIAAFEGHLADAPRSVEAHTYLARIYTVKKNFKKAAEHYDHVAAIEPFNVDACVLAALSLVDAGEVPEAALRLAEARARTTDPEVLARLDGYVAKLDGLKR
jgi:cytochrome c-type biogenesis protein CcmH/NrfG